MLIQEQTVVDNQYQILEKIGQGGMGTVYQAQDRLSHQIVAIKILHIPPQDLSFASKSDVSNASVAIINEFRILAGLRHPNIISVFDYGMYEGKPYMVMELLKEGDSFDSAVKDLDDEQKIRLILQILDALIYLHRHNIIHRDLKPFNVFVVNGQVKVLDFGLSVLGDSATGQDGTPMYMAPETLSEMKTVRQSDLYALGVLAFQAITGELPTIQHNMMTIIHQAPDLSPLGDHPAASVIGRLLLKDPADRYQTATETKQAFSEVTRLPITEEADVRESFLQASIFVGRKKELSTLKQALEDTIYLQGSSWLIAGESGVGKSRLIEELRTQALIQGAKVLQGQGVEGDGLPFQLWRDVIRRLVLLSSLTDLEASILNELIPDLDELVDKDITNAPKLQGDAHRMRLISTIIQVFEQQTQPIVLLLEDLHWVDEDLEVLQQLNARVKSLPLLVVGSFRNDERPTLPNDLPAMQVISLNRLNHEEIRALSQSMLGQMGQQENVLTFLQKETEGNAFFMVEVVRALAEEAGQLSDVGRTSLPTEVQTGGIDTIIQRRLAKVPANYQSLVEIASVLGRQIDNSLIQHLSNVVNIDLEHWKMTCADAYVLDIVSGEWRFSHDKIREGVIRSIQADKQPQIYQQAAEAIEAVYPDDDNYAGKLINLWHKAHRPNKELNYLMIEGTKLNEMAGYKNFQVSKPLFERASQLIGDNTNSQTFLEMACGMGIALLGVYDNNEASEWFEKAIALAEQLDDPSKQAHALVGLARAKIQVLPEDELLKLIDKALKLANAIDDQHMIAVCYNVQGYVYANFNHLPEALTAFQSAIAPLEATHNDYERALMLNNIGKLQQFAGDYEDAKRNLEQSRQIALKVAHYNTAVLSTSNLGVTAFFCKDYEQASEYFQQSIDLMIQTGDVSGVSHVWIFNAFAQTELHDIEAVRESIRQAIVNREQVTWDFSNMHIVMSGVLLHWMQDKLKQSAHYLGLAEKLGGANPFMREWLDPLQAKLVSGFEESELDSLLQQGAELDLETAVDDLAPFLNSMKQREQPLV